VEGQIGGAIVIEFAGERIKLAVVEKMRQLLKSRTKEDKAWTAYPDLHNSALHPTGFLRVTIDTYYGGTFRKEWVETEQKKGAEFLPEVLAGLKVIGDALVVRRREAQDEARRREERRIQEAERQRLVKLEAERWDRFRRWASDWEEAQRLRAFLAAIQAAPLKDEIDGMPAEDWLNWLRQRIDRLDPLASLPEDGG
jgi:hypothetical protein